MKHKIKNIKFSYFDKKYGLGPYIDFIGEMEVPSLEYEDVVSTLQKAHPEYKDIYLMSFSKSTINNNMKKIIYLHGLGSSGATKTVDYLRGKLTNTEVISPDIPLEPETALRELNKLCHDENPDIIVGTSMGAMYAQQMHGYRKILINPAFHVSEIMCQNMGVNQFKNPRKDGKTEFEITNRLCNDYKYMEESQFQGITAYDKAHTYAFFGTEDKLVNGQGEYLKYYTHAMQYPGGHNLQQQWVKAYILPCIKKLLEEEEDTENINAEKTYELLSVISEGGKKGHQAYDDLWRSSYINYFDITHQHREIYAHMEVMRRGFKEAVATFVCDYDEMVYESFTKHSYQIVERLFKEESAMKVYNKFVAKGRKMEPLHAMKLMAQLYMDNCGISLGDRTLAYDAGSGWLKKYIDDNPEQTEWNDFTCFSEVMPTICAEYDEEEFGHYDIAPMTIEEERKHASSYAKTIDEDSAAALCWGINYLGRSMRNDNHYLLKKVLVGSKKHLDMTEQAIFYNLKDAEEEMQKWTEHNREHLLCYIIQKIPWRKAFRDEPASSLCGWPEEPYLEESDYQEYVYMPAGYKRKHHFKVGDLVEYIYHDADVTTLRWGCIAKLPGKKDQGVLIINSRKQCEGLSKKTFVENCVKVPLRYVFPLSNYEID